MKKHSGFTLAEVLITLTIIGVVASLTLPSLNSNTGAARNRASLKKALSVLNNAVLMNEARHGWNFSGISEEGASEADCSNTNADEDFSMCALLNDAFVGETYTGNGDTIGLNNYVRHNIINNLVSGSTGALVGYQLSDGTLVGLFGYNPADYNAVCTESNQRRLSVCGGFIDVNGIRGPNQVIQCANSNDTKYLYQNNYTECEVNSNTNADVFPITFYDATVELASNAAKAYFNQ